MHIALQVKNLKLAKLLIKAGADLHLKNEDHISALELLLIDDDANDIIRELIDNDIIDVNYQTASGKHLLHIAIEKSVSNTENIELLIKKGSDVNADFKGQSVLDFAIIDRYIKKDDTASLNAKIVASLIYNGAKIQSDALLKLFSNISPGNRDKQTKLKIAKLLLEKNGNKCINAVDENGNTPLHLALANNFEIAFIRLLIENNADLNHQDKNGGTAIQIAANKHNEKIMELLLRSGANPYIVNHEGYDTFYYANHELEGSHTENSIFVLLAKYSQAKLASMNHTLDESDFYNACEEIKTFHIAHDTLVFKH
mgnify:CR=1 FL=1